MNSKWIIGVLVVALGWMGVELLGAKRSYESAVKSVGIERTYAQALNKELQGNKVYIRQLERENETLRRGSGVTVTDICTDGGRCATATTYN